MRINWRQHNSESLRIISAIEGSGSVMLASEVLGATIGRMLSDVAKAQSFHGPCLDTGHVFAVMIERIRHHTEMAGEFEIEGISEKLDIGDALYIPNSPDDEAERGWLSEAISAQKSISLHGFIDALGRVIAYGTDDKGRELTAVRALTAAAAAYLSNAATGKKAQRTAMPPSYGLKPTQPFSAIVQ